jgi:hypothetical protein
MSYSCSIRFLAVREIELSNSFSWSDLKWQPNKTLLRPRRRQQNQERSFPISSPARFQVRAYWMIQYQKATLSSLSLARFEVMLQAIHSMIWSHAFKGANCNGMGWECIQPMYDFGSYIGEASININVASLSSRTIWCRRRLDGRKGEMVITTQTHAHRVLHGTISSR